MDLARSGGSASLRQGGVVTALGSGERRQQRVNGLVGLLMGFFFFFLFVIYFQRRALVRLQNID
jgi:hypothetical protein